MDEITQMSLLIQAQQKIADDISEIKVMVKELSTTMHYVRRDQDELKTRLDRVEAALIKAGKTWQSV